MRARHLILALTLAALTGPARLCAQFSAYLPASGELVVAPQYLFQSFNHLHAGTVEYRLSDLGLAGRLKQHTVLLGLEYGVAPDVAVDATLGHVSVRLPARNADGLTDTSLGVRWRILDEFKRGGACPTVALRAGAIVAGTYPMDLGLPPTNAGDGASGFEVSLLLGKAISDTGLTAYGDIGYRNRAQGVPDDIFGTVGLAFAPRDWVTFTAAYRHEQGLSGVDILGVGFTGDWRVVKEVNHLAELGVNFSDRAGRSVAFFGSWSLAGRNTGDKTILGVSLTVPFQLRRAAGAATPP